jgi:nicotinic acid mononucleotide adenylyltransferase
VIVFPGSFNPPTTAHLALLKQAQRYARQHEPMFLYAAFSKRTVDKETVERPTLLDRILLLQIVLRRYVPHTGILLFNRGLYIEQAQAIRAAFPTVRRMLFLMGFDKIVQIFDPRYYGDRDVALDELFQLADLLVAPRGNDGEDELRALLHEPQNERFARHIHLLPFNNKYRYVSSTHIRQEEKVEAHDVPEEVRRFMRETRAYASPLLRDGEEIDYYAEREKRLKQVITKA